MKAEIISIGTELLLGQIVNADAAYLARKLAGLGIDLYYQTTVGDNPSRLAESVIRALGRADIVITTGGLGPTVDDITVETLARIISRRLVRDRGVLKDLKRYFRLRGLKLPPGSIRQAYIPRGAMRIRNRVGTAPAVIIRYKKKMIIALPGPPRELVPLFENNVIPYLRRHCAAKTVIWSRTIKTTGLAESQVNHKVKDLLKLGPKTTVGIYAKLGQVELRITTKESDSSKTKRAIKRLENIIRRRLKDNIFGYDDQTLEGAVGALLTKKRKTIAVAESCTGGLLSNRLTDTSGSSKYFMMGITTYSNATKVNMLGVREETLKRYGAVSSQAANEMALGVRLLADVDIGVGITGIAGPTGGTKTKPVGLVYVALATGSGLRVKEFRFKGSRREIKFQASQVALDMIRKNA